MNNHEDPRISYVRSKIKSYPDFPKKGIDFKDLFSAMRDTKALGYLIDLVKEKSREMKGHIDCVVGLDSRGFLFGPIMANEIGVAFVPVSDLELGILIQYYHVAFTQRQRYFLYSTTQRKCLFF